MSRWPRLRLRPCVLGPLHLSAQLPTATTGSAVVAVIRPVASSAQVGSLPGVESYQVLLREVVGSEGGGVGDQPLSLAMTPS